LYLKRLLELHNLAILGQPDQFLVQDILQVVEQEQFKVVAHLNQQLLVVEEQAQEVRVQEELALQIQVVEVVELAVQVVIM
jgi:beta-lactamase class D